MRTLLLEGQGAPRQIRDVDPEDRVAKVLQHIRIVDPEVQRASTNREYSQRTFLPESQKAPHQIREGDTEAQGATFSQGYY